MAEQLFFDHCPRPMRDAVRSYWAKKHGRLERLLQTFPEDQRRLRASIRPVKSGWEIRALVALPTGTLVAEAHGSTWQEGLDLAVDRLVFELRRHKKLIRRDYLYRRKNRRPAV
jgi:ribosome-associated translation inhibitor RaiA